MYTTTTTAPPLLIGRLWRLVVALPQLLLRIVLMNWALLRYGMRMRGHHRVAIRRAFAQRARLERDDDAWVSPLTAVRGAVYRVDPAFIACETRSSAVLAPALSHGLVVHFTGTGETRHGPLASMQLLLAHSPELAALPHYIVDAPEHAAAYGGALPFAEQLWADLSPVLQAQPGPFFFVGLSRGALAALELAARVAVEQDKIVSVLAQSPPFVRPAQMPPAIELIASCEALVTLSIEQLALFPAPAVRRAYVQLSKPTQTLLTSCVLAELGLVDEPNQTLAMRDLVRDEPVASSLRSVREFAMLTRVQQPELDEFAAKLGAVMATDTRLSVAIAWGKDDPWTPADANHALVAAAVARAGAEQANLQLHILPGVGHAFCREPAHPSAELRAIVAQLLAWTEEKSEMNRQGAKTKSEMNRQDAKTPR